MILTSECKLNPDQLSVLGVSGGPDSICLLHVLHKLGYELLAVHVNHKLRSEADEEALKVEQQAQKLGIKCASLQVNVQSYAEENAVSIEEAARVMRYQVLFNQAEKNSAQAVVVAHNADDQVETILMHFLRGSGLTGLRGMESYSLPNAWSGNIPLVRPLISTWREEILSYLEQNGIAYSVDVSNFNKMYFRNRLRHELLPYLEQYNPQIRENLLRMSQVNKEDYAVIQQLLAEAWEKCMVSHGDGYVSFRLPEFKKLSPSVQRYLLRKGIAYHLPSLRDVDFVSIQRGINFLCDDTKDGQTDLIAGLRLIKEDDNYWLATWQADLPMADFPMVTDGEELFLEIPSTLSLSNGWVLKADIETDIEHAAQQSQVNRDPFNAWIDLDKLDLPLIVRRRKPGERFQPLGMNGHSLKVSDLMVNLKLLKRARPSWPLVCTADAIVWIPGFRQSHLARIQADTRRIAHLILSKSSAS